jgi:hypothetical protein
MLNYLILYHCVSGCTARIFLVLLIHLLSSQLTGQINRLYSSKGGGGKGYRRGVLLKGPPMKYLRGKDSILYHGVSFM